MPLSEIDEKVLGENRRNYWERKLELMNDRSSQISLVAEVEGEVVRDSFSAMSAVGNLGYRKRLAGSIRSVLIQPIRKKDWQLPWLVN